MVDLENDINNAVRTLEEGGVLLYPTDTIWGLGCDALNAEAVERVFGIKQRPREKSLIVLLSDADDLRKYTGSLPPRLTEILEEFRRPVTVIYEDARGLPPNVIHPDGSIAIRITRDPFCRALITRSGKPLISTSANISGVPAPASFSEISPGIIHACDYVVRHRRQEKTAATPSSIIRIGNDGQIITIR